MSFMTLSIYRAWMMRLSSPRPSWTYLLLGAIACAGCNSAAPPVAADSSTAKTSSDKPKAGGGEASNKPGTPPRSGVPDSGAASATGKAASASATPSASAAGAVMPAEVKSCEPNKDAIVGAWTPTIDEIALAATALKADVCLKAAIREPAIRACSVKAGSPATIISTDDQSGKLGCEEHIGAIESGGRKFVVFAGYFRDVATFYGGARAVELTSAGPKLYLDALGPHSSLCAITGGGGEKPLTPAELPAGWTQLPKDAQEFICNGSK